MSKVSLQTRDDFVQGNAEQYISHVRCRLLKPSQPRGELHGLHRALQLPQDIFGDLFIFRLRGGAQQSKLQ